MKARRRSHLPFACLCALLLAGCAAPAPRSGGGLLSEERADIGGVVAADLAFARLAREQGQWRAFLETMAPGAVMFVPQQVDAAEWVSTQEEPEAPVQWRPDRVVSSCDGSLAASLGAATWPDGSHSRYISLWGRQADGTYRWLLDSSESVSEVHNAPDMIASAVADCKEPPVLEPASPRARRVSSRDDTLRYVLTSATGERPGELVVSYWTGEEFTPIYRRAVPPAR